MRVDNSTEKGTSGMDKFSSKVHRVHMELGGKLLNPLRIKTQFLHYIQYIQFVTFCFTFSPTHRLKVLKKWRSLQKSCEQLFRDTSSCQFCFTVNSV